jgi:hypothetical protein
VEGHRQEERGYQAPDTLYGERLMQIHTHHISYDPEWTVEVPGYFHRTITYITRMKDTEENYAMCVSMLHALMHECNMRRRHGL